MEPLIAARAKEKEHERKTTLQKSAKSSEKSIDTRAELAKMAGVSHDTIAKVKVIEEKASEPLQIVSFLNRVLVFASSLPGSPGGSNPLKMDPLAFRDEIPLPHAPMV